MTIPTPDMKRRIAFLLFTLCLFLLLPCLAWDESLIVTPKNQKALELDFSITAKKQERTFIVDFVIPPASTVNDLTNFSVFSSTNKFASSGGISIPFMGLTRFPRDSSTNPKQVEWVHGFRLWIGEDSVAATEIQFDHRDRRYQIHLIDYLRQSMPEKVSNSQSVPSGEHRSEFLDHYVADPESPINYDEKH